MAPTLHIGELYLNRYQVRSELRQDPFCATYLANDRTTGLSVTLVTVPTQLTENERDFVNFKRNFTFLSHLNHPNIARVHSLEQDPETDTMFYVMEHVEGIDLRTLRMGRKKEIFTVPEALKICRQIASALDFSHQYLLHRNLRPQNILITRDNVVKVTGFDLLPEKRSMELRVSHLKRHPEDALLLQNYLAPEMFFDFIVPTSTVDHYALAAIFYELTSGQLPFDTTDNRQLMFAICNSTPRMARSLSKKANQAVLQCMSKDPGNRYPTAMEFMQAVGQTGSLPAPSRRMTVGAGMVASFGLIWVTVTSLPVFAPLFLKSDPTTTVAEVTKIPATARDATLVPPVDVTIPEASLEQGSARAMAIPAARPRDEAAKRLLLRVESRPQGATLILDGKRLGTTPFNAGWVKMGPHQLRLEKERYAPVEMEVELTKDTVVDLTLDRQPNAMMSETDEKIKRAEMFSKSQVEQAKKREREVDSLLKQANRAYDNERLTRPRGESAVDLYRKVLDVDPENQAARQGLDRVIERLLAMGLEDLENWRLVHPPDQNALTKFRTVLAVDAHNASAKAGLEGIVDRLMSLAQRYTTEPDKALSYLNQAEKVLPGLPRVAEARAAVSKTH
ncbi:MAG: protein kinase [Magnetococcales bacterium]|nr:protein kinase [Magnetococcales bacterium]